MVNQIFRSFIVDVPVMGTYLSKSLPEGSQLLSVVNSSNNICISYLSAVTEATETEKYSFLFCKDGDNFPYAESYTFLGTVNLHNDKFVYHVFYKKN